MGGTLANTYGALYTDTGLHTVNNTQYYTLYTFIDYTPPRAPRELVGETLQVQPKTIDDLEISLSTRTNGRKLRLYFTAALLYI